MKRRARKSVNPTQSSSPMKWARYYLKVQGWAPIPLEKGSKKPLVAWKYYQSHLPTTEQVTEWWTKWPEAGVAIVCGQVSGGLMVLDIDSKEARQVIEQQNPLPPTPTVATARGRHLYFQPRAKFMGQQSKEGHNTRQVYPTFNGDGWELKGDKALVTAPPSVHSSGHIYEWDLKPGEVSLAPLPTWLGELLERKGRPALDELEALLLKYWTPGHRDDLAFALSGCLFNLGWPRAMARHLFEKVGQAASDEELADRLKVLEDTYKKGEKGKPVAGLKRLQDILSATDYPPFEELAKARQVPKRIRLIDSIRKGKAKTFEINRTVAQTVYQDLCQRGHFLHAFNFKYFFNEETYTVEDVEGEGIERLLDLEYGLNPAETPIFNVVKYFLRDMAVLKGKAVRVYRTAHYDTASNILYIHAGAGWVYRLDGSNIVRITNGTDGVFFEELPDMVPFQASLDTPADPYQALVADLSFDTGEGVALSPDYQRDIFWLWLRTLFFEELQPTKPLLTLTGDKGSGKTTALRRIMKLLVGEAGQVSDIRNEDSWAAAISHNYLLALDNVDIRSKWLPNKLNLVSTGQIIEARQLYKTNVLLHLRPHCFVAMSSVSPPFSEATVADRMLLLRMKPLEKITPDRRLSDRILSNRNQLWAGMLWRLNKDIQLIKGDEIEVSFRMADWASIVAKLMVEKPGGGIDLKRMFRGLQMEAALQVLTNSPVLDYLDIWEPEPDRWYSAAELFSLWQEVCKANHIHFYFKNIGHLGKHLVNIRGALKTQYGLKWSRAAGNKFVYCWPK